MCQIAVCIPTYNHSEIINDVLKDCVDDYEQYGIDIYYFDSSEDNKTFEIVKKYQDKGYNNLFYNKIPVSYLPHKKILSFFKGEGLQKEYDYIWPVKDRSFCPDSTLKKINDEIRKKRDVIFLGVINNGHMINREYHDSKKFYKEWGWLSTSLDVVIYNKKTILNYLDNPQYEELCQQRYYGPWCSYVTLFHKLTELENANICVLCDSETQIYNSPLGKSTWEKNVFEIWKDDWIQANDNLPSCYDEYKDDVIKYTASLPWILGGIPRLMELHQKGILTEESYDTVIENWERVSDIPRETVKEIAYGIYDKFHDVSSLNVHSEITSLLIQLIKLLRTGKMKKEQIPFDNIAKCIQGEILSTRKCSEELINSIIGSITDVLNFAKSEASNIDDVILYMQIIINFIELTK